MNKLAKRAWFALALAGVLLLGMGVIVVRYFIDSPDWVTFQNSPHVYTDGVMNSGKIVDRGGTVVLDATNGKSYADSASLRRSMLHPGSATVRAISRRSCCRNTARSLSDLTASTAPIPPASARAR